MKRMLSLVLALMLVAACANGALAETAVDSFIDVYNNFLPDLFDVLDIDDSDGSLEQMLRLSYNSELTESTDLPSYSSQKGLFHVVFLDEDDPHGGFLFSVVSEDPGLVGAMFKMFIIYFGLSGEPMELDEINQLIGWSAGDYLQQPEIDCAGYHLEATVEDSGITMISMY